jgi:hypothetical protein
MQLMNRSDGDSPQSTQSAGSGSGEKKRSEGWVRLICCLGALKRRPYKGTEQRRGTTARHDAMARHEGMERRSESVRFVSVGEEIVAAGFGFGHEGGEVRRFADIRKAVHGGVFFKEFVGAEAVFDCAPQDRN